MEADGNEPNEEMHSVICATSHISPMHIVEINSMIDSIPSLTNTSGLKNDKLEAMLEKCQRLMDLYQEQPHLLDQILEDLVDKLINIISSDWVQTKQYNITADGFVAFKLLVHLTKVRGFKVMMQHLPHHIRFLKPVLCSLESLMTENMNIFSSDASYILLLWLNILSQNPFSLSHFDNDVEETVARRIMNICQWFLKNRKDKNCDGAARLLCQIVTRPDMKDGFLASVLNRELLSILDNNNESTSTGSIQVLIGIFKHGDRIDLLPIAKEIIIPLIKQYEHDLKNGLVRKLMVKLIQRIGLVFLQPRVAAWKYHCGNKCILDTLFVTSAPSAHAHHVDHNAFLNGHDQNILHEYDIDAYDDNLHQHVEFVLNVMLQALRDRDTIVRWSAAKGIGRLSARLSRQMADDVVSTLLDSCFGPLQSDAAWHGGCLALAELARRGYLLSQRLPHIIPILLKALVFDEAKGRHSVGSHVRDAACYICWSIARAFDPSEIRPYINDLASSLVTVSVFDREINVRRAASAAFQENVGRQGCFPHGIEITTEIDYFAVGQRRKCFLDLAVFVAKYPEYTHKLIDHLIEFKIPHWDEQIRLLSAEALRRLAKIDPEYVSKETFVKLLAFSDQNNLFAKQGSLLALGKVGMELINMNEDFIIRYYDILKLIPKKIAAIHLTNTKAPGVQLIRVGLNVFIASLGCTSFISSNLDCLKSWQEIIDRNLMDVSEKVRCGAQDALSHLWPHYSAKSSAVKQIMSYEKIFEDATSEHTRIGAALALATVPKNLLQIKSSTSTYGESPDRTIFEKILILLTNSIINQGKKDGSWAEARVNAVKAISELVQRMDIVCDWTAVFDSLLTALNDYTVNKRGDVGRLVREASIDVLALLLPLAQSRNMLQMTTSHTAIGRLLQQSCEKIDATRKKAADALSLLVHNSAIPMHHRDILCRVFPSPPTMPPVNWSMAHSAFAALAQLLTCQYYLYNVLLGFVISAGGVTESTMRSASEALLSHLRGIERDKGDMERFLNSLADIFSDFATCDRVVMPMLAVLDRILTEGVLSSLDTDPDNCAPLNRLIHLTTSFILERETKRNPRKMRASIQVMCGILQFNSSSKIWTKAVFCLTTALCHRLPAIRRATAELFYEALLTYASLDNHTETVLSLLTETSWESDQLDQLHQVQTLIAEYFALVL